MWIKEPADEYVTISGTVMMVLDDSQAGHESSGNDEKSVLKHTSKGVILHPQPHDDPNDPLNWPVWRRDISLVTVSIFALLAGGMTPLLAPVMNTLQVEFNKPFHALTYFVGVLMASMGVGSALFAPIAVKYGKRLVYLGSMLVFFGGLVWGANAKSYGSLMGARVLSGLGASPAESLPSTTIAEIYFAHERAYRLGIYTLLLLGGKNLSPLASGFIAGRLGWHWIFWVAAIICAGAFVGTFLFIHETFWDRTPIPNERSQRESEAAQRARANMNLPPWEEPYEIRRPSATSLPQPSSTYTNGNDVAGYPELTQSSPSLPTLASPHSSLRSLTPRPGQAHETPLAGVNASEVTSSSADFQQSEASAEASASENPSTATSKVLGTDGKESTEPVTEMRETPLKRKPFFKNLSIYSGEKTDAKLWMIFVRPFVLYSYLPVAYATLIYGTSVVWLSVIAETINSIFTAEPYNFKGTSVGLLYIGTFSGGVLGSLVAGKISDLLVRKMSRMNNGIYEPEFRLVMILPVMIAVTIGLMGFGWSTHVHDRWIAPAVFLGVLGFGTSLASTVSITYVVDCYRRFALEALVSLNFAKNMLGLAFSIFVPYFFQASGSKTSFVVYGCVEIGLCLLAIPLYHYGKVIRRFHDKHAWADAFYVHPDTQKP